MLDRIIGYAVAAFAIVGMLQAVDAVRGAYCASNGGYAFVLISAYGVGKFQCAYAEYPPDGERNI